MLEWEVMVNTPAQTAVDIPAQAPKGPGRVLSGSEEVGLGFGLGSPYVNNAQRLRVGVMKMREDDI